MASGTPVPSALTEGFQHAFWAGAAIAFVGVLVSLFLVRQRDFETAPALEAVRRARLRRRSGAEAGASPRPRAVWAPTLQSTLA